MQNNNDFSIISFSFWRDVENQYNPLFIKRNLAVKIAEDETSVAVCIAESEMKKETQVNLESFHNPKVLNILTCPKSDFTEFIGIFIENNPDKSIKRENQLSEDITEVSSSATAVNIVNAICLSALRKRASDIHIHKQGEKGIVRFRIDGILTPAIIFPLSSYDNVISRIKSLSHMNISEKRLPQDGRLTLKNADGNFDSRVSITPSLSGEVVVMRLFETINSENDISSLGFSDEIKDVFEKVVLLKSGLVLITGPTGSGKTTTIHSLLSRMDRKSLKIITIEDPVEIITIGVDQIAVNPEIGLTFAEILRRVLRQDPDVIMVGEIRDGETASLALRAALTGHLVLSTLHTTDSISAITRLEDLGVEPYLIASVLKYSFAQRLVRRINKNAENEKYSGRLAVCEAFENTSETARIIAKGKSEKELRDYLKDDGFKDIKFDAKRKVEAGLCDEGEIRREGLL